MLEHSQISKRAYDIDLEANDLDDNYVEDVNSFVCEGLATTTASSSTIAASSIKVGTDCSGGAVPIIALKNRCTIQTCILLRQWRRGQKIIQANSKPGIISETVQKRNSDQVPDVDLHAAGFPCQPSSTIGKQQGFEDDQGRGEPLF